MPLSIVGLQDALHVVEVLHAPAGELLHAGFCSSLEGATGRQRDLLRVEELSVDKGAGPLSEHLGHTRDVSLHRELPLLLRQVAVAAEAHAARGALDELGVPQRHIDEVDAADVLELYALPSLRGLRAKHAEPLAAEVPARVVEVAQLLEGRDLEALLLPRSAEDLDHRLEAHLASEQ